MDWALTFVLFGLSVFIGFKGNAMTGRHYLDRGYEFATPDGVESHIAAESWNV